MSIDCYFDKEWKIKTGNSLTMNVQQFWGVVRSELVHLNIPKPLRDRMNELEHSMLLHQYTNKFGYFLTAEGKEFTTPRKFRIIFHTAIQELQKIVYMAEYYTDSILTMNERDYIACAGVSDFMENLTGVPSCFGKV